MTSKKNEDDLKKIKNEKLPKQKWKTNQSTKINLIGWDTIVNSPSLMLLWSFERLLAFKLIPIRHS